MNFPRYLRNVEGGPKEPPAHLKGPFLCPTCGERLVFAGSYWVCPKGFHSKAKTHAQLIEELRVLMEPRGYRRWTPEGIFHIQRRVEFYRQRQEARDRLVARLVRQVAEAQRA